jgi:hypothetical protein
MRIHKISTLAARAIVLGGLLVSLQWMPVPAAAQTTPAAAPVSPALEFVFEEIVTIGAGVHVGSTPWGERNIVPITGGTFAGPHIKGKILPGGWDWQLATATKCLRIQADYMIQTEDGAIINVVNKGTLCTGADGKASKGFTTPVFEAPIGPYDWLNGGAYVGTFEGMQVDGKPTVRIRFFKAI